MLKNFSMKIAFIIFHLTLGIVVFVESIFTVMHALNANNGQLGNHHLALFAGTEALAALLFLFPATLKVGGVSLLVIFAIAIVMHGLHSALPLLVYAAGIIFVMAHGSAYGKKI